ncbi:MAG: MFS transporter [Myxococcota bacterium]|nr:MFS transporter [Myxococcota bacterium]
MQAPGSTRGARLAVAVAALGYFVDIYDLVLFGVVRKASLEGLGLQGEAIKTVGVDLLNWQMGGMLVGGVLWGVLGDRIGRLPILFGSILVYSLANVANGFVQDIPTYAALRFIAGIGLAGELGGGITLVSELLSRHARGYGTTLVAAIGICGAVAASLVGDLFDWRTSYFIGGGLGLLLLLLRVGVYESGMFERTRASGVSRGNFLALFSTLSRARRYLAVVVVGVPIWYAVGILVMFSPEIGAAMGMPQSAVPTASRAILWCYVGLAAGDLASGLLSQLLRSRKRALVVFLGITTVAIALYFGLAPLPLPAFYAICALLGFGTGYWAVFVTVAAEQFGTNLRATATTTAPNFVRGAVVPLTTGFRAFEPSLGTVGAALAVGVLALGLAVVALASLEETYGKDLDFVES